MKIRSNIINPIPTYNRYHLWVNSDWLTACFIKHMKFPLSVFLKLNHIHGPHSENVIPIKQMLLPIILSVTACEFTFLQVT